MRDCEKRCIANINGKCTVPECQGPIVRIDGRPFQNVEDAAKFYAASKKAFAHYFGEKS